LARVSIAHSPLPVCGARITSRQRQLVIAVTVLLTGVAIAVIVLANTFDPGIPPQGSAPLADILARLEGGEADLITEVEFDGKHWEIEMRSGARWLTLFIDPRTGLEADRDREEAEEELPPAGALAVSQIVRTLAGSVAGVITEVDFENGAWEVTVRRDEARTVMHVDPATGEVRE